jgi:hypothetical protein
MRSIYTEKSSRIVAIEYDPDTKTMKIVFKRGGVYSYSDVPEEIMDAFGRGGSLGKTFDALVRGKFNYQKL